VSDDAPASPSPQELLAELWMLQLKQSIAALKEDKPSDEELFGTFYDAAMEAEVEAITT